MVGYKSVDTKLAPEYDIMSFYKLLVVIEETVGHKKYFEALKKMKEIIDDEVKLQERLEVK